MSKKSLSAESLPSWRVNRIVGHKAREICQIQARTAEEAIKRTIKEFGITDPNQQSRLAAYRVNLKRLTHASGYRGGKTHE